MSSVFCLRSIFFLVPPLPSLGDQWTLVEMAFVILETFTPSSPNERISKRDGIHRVREISSSFLRVISYLLFPPNHRQRLVPPFPFAPSLHKYPQKKSTFHTNPLHFHRFPIYQNPDRTYSWTHLFRYSQHFYPIRSDTDEESGR